MAHEADVKRAYDLAKAGQETEARALIQSVLAVDRDNIQAWGVLYQVSADGEEAMRCLNNILRLRPNDEWARSQLRMLEAVAPPPQEGVREVVYANVPDAAGVVAGKIEEFLRSCLRARLNIMVLGEDTGRNAVFQTIKAMIPYEESTDRPIHEAIDEGNIPALIQRLSDGASGALFAFGNLSQRDAVDRIDQLCKAEWRFMLPLIVTEKVATALHVIVLTDLLPDGYSGVREVSVVEGFDGVSVQMANVYALDPNQGQVLPTGLNPPRIIKKLEAAGVGVPEGVFKR